MLKSGMFLLDGKQYPFYEVEEKGFYRIDFLREPGAFHVDYDKVVYSLFQKKKSKAYGDKRIYEAFTDLQSRAGSIQLSTETEGYWENGQYVSKTVSVNNKYSCQIETVKVNGNITDTTLVLGQDAIVTTVTDPIYGIKMDPINIADYQEIVLSKDNVDITNSSDKPFYTLDVLKRRYDIGHLDAKDLVVAEDIETARKRLARFRDSESPFKAFDTETTGTAVYMYGESVLTGIVLAEDTETSTYYPFRHDGVNCKNLPLSFLAEIMEVLIAQQDRLVAHNKKFDRQVMLKEGYDLHVKWDSLQLAYIIFPSITADHGLKYLASLANGKVFLELTNIFVNSADIDFSVLPADIVKYYACPDGINTLEVLYYLLKQLPSFQEKLFELECDLADVKADQEYYGIRVDVKKYEHQYKNCNYVIDLLLTAFRKLTQEDGNINSSAVLANLIYNKMKCKTIAWTNTGQPSTSSATIDKLASEPATTPHVYTQPILDLDGNVIIKAEKLANAKYPALLILSVYKKYLKLQTAFYARFERTMNTGRVFFWVNQNGAASGRQSSPMHQLPPELKECILADSIDHDFWGPDFSQIELRMIAYLAGEKDLIELASDPDNDIHRVIGSLIANKEMWAITPEERSKGKRRNFGFVYGISGIGLAKQMHGPNPTKEQIEECANSLDDLFHRFKRIDRYVKNNATKVKTRGYMETAWYHRRRYFPEVKDPDIEPRRLASIVRMGNNMPVQGTAADYLKLAEVQMYRWIYDKGWNKLTEEGFPLVRMMLSIHDEIIISAHSSIPYEAIVEMITKCMETPVEGAPPFFVQPAKMSSWGDHSADDLAMPIRLRDEITENYSKNGTRVFKRSFFKLEVEPEVTSALNDTKSSISSLVESFEGKARLVFLRGDYIRECSAKQVQDALTKYIESGVTTYSVDNYLDVLNTFRKERLDSYMHGLIAQYGMDGDAVGAHVRHPSLTHELLAVYKKRISGKGLSHEESITYAAKCYIEDMQKGVSSVESSGVVTDKSDDRTIAAEISNKWAMAQLDNLVTYDEHGKAIFEESEVDVDIEDEYIEEEDIDYTLLRNLSEPVYVWELGDAIVFDARDVTNTQDVQRILNYIGEHQDPDGFYQVRLYYGDRLLDTTMRIEKLDFSEANKFVLNMSRKTA